MTGMSLVGTLLGKSSGYTTNLADLSMISTAEGLVLVAANRQGGGLTTFDIESAGKAGTYAGHSSYGNSAGWLGRPDLTLLPTEDGFTAFAAGLKSGFRAGANFDDSGVADGRAVTALPWNAIAAAGFMSGDDSLVVLARAGGTAIESWRLTPGGTASAVSQVALTSRPGAQIDDIAIATVGGAHFAISASTKGGFVTSHRVADNGAMGAGQTFGLGWRAPFSQPTEVEAVTSGRHSFVIVAGAGSSSLTTFRLGDDGLLRAADHILDERTTRFAGASDLAAVTLNGRGYVFAAGADDGVSMFLVLPDGRLVHTATLADGKDTALNNVSGLAAEAMGGRIVVAAASATEKGISQFVVDPGPRGVTKMGGEGIVEGGDGNDVIVASSKTTRVIGGEGDDTLASSNGAVVLVGGGGADLFLPSAINGTIVIKDFNAAEDRLDLSNLGMTRSVEQMSIRPTSEGMMVSYGSTVLRVISADGNSLQTSIIDNGDFPIAHYPVPGQPVTILGTAKSERLFAGRDQVIIDALGGSDVVEGGFLADRLSGGAGADRIRAWSGNDWVSGGSGNDQIYGKSGNDTLLGDTGNDVVAGEDGLDLLFGGSGNDKLLGGIHRDRLFGDAGADALYGGDGDDSLNGGLDDDLLKGEAGNDRLLDSHGNNELDGGDGEDSLTGGSGRDVLLGGDGRDTLFGNAGNDRLLGELHRDVLNGGDGNDRLLGGEGDDTLDGGEGVDTLYGDAGHDRLTGRNGNDALYGGDGRDTIDGGTGNDLLCGGIDADGLLGGDGNDTLKGELGADRLVGGRGNDLIGGDDGNDRMAGQDGNDRIGGGKGDDYAAGDAGSDKLDGNEGRDRLLGGTGSDTLKGGSDADSLDGGADNDTVSGDSGDDLLTGGGGNDWLSGGSGNDRVEGGAGNDRLSGDRGTDLVKGGEGNDTLDGGDDDDRLHGENGSDRLSGGSGRDRLHGDAGNDRLDGGGDRDALFGGDGNDVLIGGGDTDQLFGGRGCDVLTGGTGADAFIFHKGDSSAGKDRDRIVDFEHGTDHVDLRGLDLTFAGTRFSSAGDEVIATTQSGGMLIQIDFDGDGKGDMAIFATGLGRMNEADFLL